VILKGRKLFLAVLGALAMAEPAVAESGRTDPAGFRCIENTQGDGREIARPAIPASGPVPDRAIYCTMACDRTPGCMGYNIVHRVEGGRDEYVCVLLGSVSRVDWFEERMRHFGMLCYRLAGPVPPAGRGDCPPHMEGCVPPRALTDPRPPSAADDRPGQARPSGPAPPVKK
jgi:hypothetical protein